MSGRVTHRVAVLGPAAVRRIAADAAPIPFDPEAGSSSGRAVVRYTGAALAGELRALAHPVSIDPVPTADDQEAHAPRGMTAARLSLAAIERDRAPGRPGEGRARRFALLRSCAAPLDADRRPAPDIEAVRGL